MMRKFAVLTLLALLVCTACTDEPMGTLALSEGVSCRLYGSAMGVRRVEVVGADGSLLDTVTLPAPDIEPSELGGAEVLDLDFDGDLDLRLRAYQYTGGDLRYTCYRWQGGELVPDEILSAMRGLTVDAEAQTITAWSSRLLPDEYELTTRTTYVWVDGEPVESARRSLYHYIAEGEEMYRVLDVADGVEEERWIFPEKFNAEDIWN